MYVWTSVSLLWLSFCQFLVVFGQNEIANFSDKAGAFLCCAFHCGPLLILPRWSSTRYSQCNTWRCNILLSHLSCQGPSVLSVQLILFCPIQPVNFPTFVAMFRALFDVVSYIIRKNSSRSVCGHPPFTRSFSSLPKVSCFLTSTLNYFWFFPICLWLLLFGAWFDQWVSAEFFCGSSLGKGWVAQTHCKLGIGIQYMDISHQ